MSWFSCMGWLVQSSRPSRQNQVVRKNIQTNGGYNQTFGFNYDWTQDINTSGTALASFLNQLASNPAVTSIDLEVHSEGGPVALSAGAPPSLVGATRSGIDPDLRFKTLRIEGRMSAICFRVSERFCRPNQIMFEPICSPLTARAVRRTEAPTSQV